MVSVKDFGFVQNYALEDQTPTSATGYIQGTCDNYHPPPGYAITSCLKIAGTTSISGIAYQDLSKITVSHADIANTNMAFIGIGVVVLAGAVLFALFGGKKEKRIAASRGVYQAHTSYAQNRELDKDRFQF